MADAAMLLVEALYQLRSSIDAMAQDQAQARGDAPGAGLALAIVDGLSEIRNAVDNLSTQQAAFQSDVVSILTDISRSLDQVPQVADAAERVANDLSLITDRYRPEEPMTFAP